MDCVRTDETCPKNQDAVAPPRVWDRNESLA
jgi:hypothetical protein